jgi:hypothetical protein
MLERKQKLVMFVASCFLLAADVAYSENAESLGMGEEGVKIDVVQGRQLYLVGGPIPVTIQISNISDQVVYVFLHEYRPHDIGFVAQLEGKSATRSNAFLFARDDYSENPVSIPSGGVERFNYDLNRFACFTRPGQYGVDYSVRIIYCKPNSGFRDLKNATKTGSLVIQAVEADEPLLRKSWDDLVNRANGSSRSERVACAEAVCHMNHSMAIEYIGKLVRSDLYEVRFMGVMALNRFGTPEVYGILHDLLGSETESGIVELALTMIKKRKIDLQEPVFRGLLNNPESNVRWHALDYLIKVRKPLCLDTVTSLTFDKNAAISNAAKQVIESLR